MISKNKRGLSGVVTTVLLIGLTLIAVAIIWTFINSLISESLEESESCFGNFGKVEINSLYTCYNPTTQQFRFSISVGDIDLDRILISIYHEGTTRSFTLENETTSLSGLTNYQGEDEIRFPSRNSGETYITDFDSKPDRIEIAPTIGGTQCEKSDVLNSIDICTF